MRIIYLLLLICCHLGFNPPTFASDLIEQSPWQFNGFGTLGGSYHNHEDLGYRRNLEQSRWSTSDRLNFHTDSNLGLQISYNSETPWSITAQSVARLNSEGSWKPYIPLAFAKYQFANNLEARLGRLPLDIYLDGDSRHVGYAYTTTRPTPDIYGLIMYDHFDGADILFKRQVGNGVGSLRLYAGEARGSYFLSGNNYKLGENFTYGASLHWSTHLLSITAAAGQIHGRNFSVSASEREALELLSRLPIAGLEQASNYINEVKDKNKINFVGIGMKWDQGPWTTKLLGTQFNFSAFPNNQGQAGMVELAYRINQIKPYASLSYLRIKPDSKPLDFPSGSLFQGLEQLYNKRINYLASDQLTLGLGVRYDLTENIALKLQYDRIQAKRSALLKDYKSLSQLEDRNMNLYSISLDFVF